jgi:DNA replication protein DnaC
MTDTLNIANRLSKIVVSESEAAKRLAQREAVERNGRVIQYGDPLASAPKRHREASSLSMVGPWAEKLSWLKQRAGTGILVAMIGTRGGGKTQMAVEVMREMASKSYIVRFTTCMELLMRFKASYRAASERSEFEVMEEFCRPKLLVIDEVARRGETDWENNLLFELINQRYGDMRDTILTCNLTREELQGSMGPSIVSRMLETGGVMECNWESYRGKKNQ